MKKISLLVFLFLGSIKLFAQNGIDSLTFERKLFGTSVYKNGVKYNNSRLMAEYRSKREFKSERLLHNSKALIPLGVVVSAGGIYLGFDALKGTKYTQLVGNTEYTYTERPIFQLIGGIGLLAAGVCLMEYGNDAKVKSIELYNSNKNGRQSRLGLTPSGNLGFYTRL